MTSLKRRIVALFLTSIMSCSLVQVPVLAAESLSEVPVEEYVQEDEIVLESELSESVPDTQAENPETIEEVQVSEERPENNLLADQAEDKEAIQETVYNVRFLIDSEDAKVIVFQINEDETFTVFEKEESDSEGVVFNLDPGEYFYSVTCDGYEPVESETLTVGEDGEVLEIEIDMEPEIPELSEPDLEEATNDEQVVEELPSEEVIGEPVQDEEPAGQEEITPEETSVTSTDTWQAVIEKDEVNVRENAGTGFDALGTLEIGDLVMVIGFAVDSDGNTWYRVTTEDSLEGFVREDMLSSVTEEPTSETEQEEIEEPLSEDEDLPPEAVLEPEEPEILPIDFIEAVVIRDDVNVRAEANTGSGILRTMDINDMVVVTGSLTDEEGYTWYQISLDESNGFIREDMLSFELKVEAVQPEETKTVQVCFITVPDEAVVSVCCLDESDSLTELEATDLHVYDLLPGDYYYSVSCEGYKAIVDKAFLVEQDKARIEIPVTLLELVPEEKKEVSVRFIVDPGHAEISVKGINESGETIVFEESDEHAFHLLPGEYTYSAECKGYTAVEAQLLTVGPDTELVIEVELKPVLFDETKLGIIAEDNVNVRRKADVRSEVIGTLNTDDEVDIIGSSSDTEGNTWYLIVFNNDQTGFVREDLILVFELIEEYKTVSLEASGTRIPNTDVTWSIGNTGILSITGTGSIPSYSTTNTAPWYLQRDYIKAINIEKGITTIGRYAFNECHSAKTISIATTVTTIDAYSFRNCSSLTSISIPGKTQSIGAYAFDGCSSLTSVSIPVGVVSIGRFAFGNCTSLTNISIPRGITIIESSTFSGCSNLISVYLPDDIKKIGDYAFNGCSSLTNISIPSKVTSIEPSTFQKCSSLKNINMPVGLKTIGSSAFIDCSSLVSIYIPDGVTEIGSSAFKGCTSLTYIDIPEEVVTIGSSAFGNCSNLIGVNIQKGIISIGGFAFDNCTNLQYVSISEGVESIGSYAFHNCRNLESISILNGLVTIEDGAFSNCSSLVDLTISSGLVTIGDYAFHSCNSLTSIDIPDSVVSIGQSAFSSCLNLKNVSILFGITTIEDSTFSCCDSLTEIIIPESITRIGESAFSSCDSLINVSIPGNVSTIDNSAFFNCYNLTNLIIQEGVKSIKDSAFGESYNLKNVCLPSSITSIGNAAFGTISEHTKEIENVYYTGTKKEWGTISIGANNERLLKSNIHYNLDTVFAKISSISSSSKGVDIKWDIVPNASRYKIYRKEGKTDWVLIRSLKENSFKDTTALMGSTYEYKIHADGNFNCVDDSQSIMFNPFTDVEEGTNAFTYIAWAYNNKIVFGTGDGSTFSPKNTCTRGQFATMLYRMAGRPSVAGMTHPFTDVSGSLTNPILWAYNAGIVGGTSATTFSPSNGITRSQVISMLYRMAGRPAIKGTSNPFTDVKKSQSIYRPIMWAYENKITGGTSKTTFSPKAYCTRQQLVTFLYKFNRLYHYI